MHDRAGTAALPSDLIDIDELIRAYHDLHPDVEDPEQKVAFGTSGHRGSSLKAAFNEDHILAITQAIVEHRAEQGITGPLFIGRDTHGLSKPAEDTALGCSSPTACACSPTPATPGAPPPRSRTRSSAGTATTRTGTTTWPTASS